MKKSDETKDCCPNCGHCPHCGRSDRPPPVIPAPYPNPVPVPARPYRGPYWYGEPTIWSGGDSTAAPRFGNGYRG
jgi:hypothetical protein